MRQTTANPKSRTSQQACGPDCWQLARSGAALWCRLRGQELLCGTTRLLCWAIIAASCRRLYIYVAMSCFGICGDAARPLCKTRLSANLLRIFASILEHVS